MTTEASAKKRILIVDDEPHMVETLADILEDQGCAVSLASNGRRALRHVEEQPVDLVLMDVVMPEMNGLETFRAMKRLSPDTAVVMMTGHKVDHLVQEAVNEGSMVLQKPIDPATLVGLILTALRLAN
jgi:DNA-binding NtrC family response regulator